MNYPDKKKYEQCITDIGSLLQKTSGIFQLMERENMKKNGFTSSQSYLMVHLLEAKELTVNEIAVEMNLEKSSVSRMVQILIRQEMLNKTLIPEDKRSVQISLTEKGKKTAKEIDRNRKKYFSSIITHLPKGHVREVMNSAEILFKALEQALKL